MDAGTLVERAAARLAAERGWVPDPALRKLPVPFDDDPLLNRILGMAFLLAKDQVRGG